MLPSQCWKKNEVISVAEINAYLVMNKSREIFIIPEQVQIQKIIIAKI
jgi:hypothetical protein